MPARTFAELFARAREHDDYWMVAPTMDFAEEIIRRLNERCMSRGALARALNVSPAYVTKVLRGDENLTIRSMTKIARAVGCSVRVSLQQHP